MTSIHPQPLGITKVITDIHQASEAGTVTPHQAKSFLSQLSTAYSADLAKYGAAYVTSHPSHKQMEAIMPVLQTIVARAVNRVVSGLR